MYTQQCPSTERVKLPFSLVCGPYRTAVSCNMTAVVQLTRELILPTKCLARNPATSTGELSSHELKFPLFISRLNCCLAFLLQYQIHLAYRGVGAEGSPSGMTVMWTSAAGERPPVVLYGLSRDK